MKQIKLGIIGVGNMGTGHINYIMNGEVPEVKITAVADRREDRREWCKEKFKGHDVQIFTEADDLIENGDVDSIIIAVPHYQHPILAVKGFDKGLHVLCEKPAGVYTKAVKVMNEAAAKSDRTFAMMFNQRTNCLYRKMKEIVASGELGEIRRVSWLITDWFRSQIYYDSGAWRATWAGEGGGVLLNQCPHNLDLLQWICGMPSKVTAFLHEGKWHDIEVEDDVTAYLEYPNGATGVFVTTTGDAPGTNRFEVTLDGGKLVCEDNKLMLYKLETPISEYIKTSTDAFAAPKTEIIEVETDGQSPQHKAVLKAFARNILYGEPLVAGGEEGINGLTLSNAMHLSSWTNAAVTLPLDEDLYEELLNQRRATSRHKEDMNITFTTEKSYNN